jgi:hypothetical protein
MNRNEAIEQALMKCNSLDMGDCVEIPLAQWEAVEEALAMPKDAEREAMGEWLIEQGIFPKADAERVALLADVDKWLKGDTENPLQDAEEVLWAVHTYLQGGA